jgi:guanosine-3',5'-bis(diphosphate) 3'-pyrophosphohydrolase
MQTIFNIATLDSFSAQEKEHISHALEFATNAHHGQTRKSGEPYISHPIAVAKIVCEWGMDAESVIAALLHDTIEDTDVTVEDIEHKFGSKVAALVQGLTKLAMIDSIPGPEASSLRLEASKENLRKLLIATSKDYRTLLIKLADRLHNMRTLKHLSQSAQKRIATESLDVYSPLADRLGMGQLKCEIEDLSFKYIDPEAFQKLKSVVSKTTKAAEKSLGELQSQIQIDMEKDGLIPIKIEGRQKHLYSIQKKLVKVSGDISKIYDLMAIRIIVEDIPACYQTLGLIHHRYKPLIYRIKDYIAVPKPNGYRSLHTTVFATQGRIIEIQIRTPEMHTEAEYGLAAHYFYDQNKTSKNYQRGKGVEAVPEKMSWVQEVIQLGNPTASGAETSDINRIELFSDRIFVFSPKGDLYDLPEGSTPVDFAFSIHSNIGLRTMGAKINGKMAPLDRVLENRDVVEIITKREPGPNRDWLGIVHTSAARNKIKSWFRSMSREANIASGKTILDTELKVWGIKRLEDVPERHIREALDALSMKSTDDLLAGIGEGMLTSAQAIRKLLPDAARPSKLKIIMRPAATGKVLFEGEVLPYVFAACCNPVYPQRLIGYVTRGSGVTVHREGCNNIPGDSDRYIKSKWETKVDKEPNVLCHLQIDGVNRLGLLSDVTSAISDQGFNIGNLSSRDTDDNESIISVSVEVPDLFSLPPLLKRLKRLPGITDAIHLSE